MELYIGTIPSNVDDYDLRKFFNIVGNQASFRIITHDHGNDIKTRYGVAQVESEKLGFRLIAMYNGKSLKGSAVVVREYLHRNYSNDRRALNWRQMPWQGEERRQEDRRGNLMRAAVAREPMLAIEF